VCLIDVNRAWLKSRFGLAASEVPRDISFCTFAALEDSPNVFIVENATTDPRFQANPCVTGELGVRFYVAVAILCEGVKIGTLCVLDTVPHYDFSSTQQEMLEELGNMVGDLIKKHKCCKQQSACDLPNLAAAVLQNLREPLQDTLLQKQRLETYLRVTTDTTSSNYKDLCE
jgi:GAF domain-containing protein